MLGPMDTPNRSRGAAAGAGELAARIYVELVARASHVAEGKVLFAANAREMAALSLQLADAFLEVEETIAAGKRPKAAFSLDAADVASWSKPTG